MEATKPQKQGRPKEFELELVLDAAVEAFSAKGYEATSIQDLVEAMGMNRYSIYEEFGGKHGLFLAALDRYHLCRRIRAASHFAPSDSRMEQFRQWFQMIHNDARKGGGYGCMMVNSAVEMAREDGEVAWRISDHYQKLEEIFVRVLVDAKARGEIETDHNPAALARFLLNVSRGLRVMVTYERDQEVFDDILNLAFTVLRP